MYYCMHVCCCYSINCMFCMFYRQRPVSLAACHHIFHQREYGINVDIPSPLYQVKTFVGVANICGVCARDPGSLMPPRFADKAELFVACYIIPEAVTSLLKHCHAVFSFTVIVGLSCLPGVVGHRICREREVMPPS